MLYFFFFFQAEDGIRDLVRSRGLGDVYKRQAQSHQFSHFSAPDDSEEGMGTAKKGRDFSDIRAQSGGDVFLELKRHIAALEAAQKIILIASYGEGSRQRLCGLMDHAGIGPLKNCESWEDTKKLKPGQVGVAVLALEHGFVADDCAVITEQDILGDRIARKTKTRRKADNFLREVSSLNPGDLVVHVDHGIGRFEGGAQGEHKLARGLLPVRTTSAHWIRDERFADAVQRYLERESAGIADYFDELEAHTPFRIGE